MNILILDTETTGLDPAKGSQVIEIGAILFNIEEQAPLQYLSYLLPCEENAVEHINGIKPSLTKRLQDYDAPHKLLLQMFDFADVIVAHNAEFDFKFIASIPALQEMIKYPWVCTKKDFKWPVKLSRFRLQDVCEAMGIRYVEAHRALNDCRFLANCFAKIPQEELILQFSKLIKEP